MESGISTDIDRSIPTIRRMLNLIGDEISLRREGNSTKGLRGVNCTNVDSRCLKSIAIKRIRLAYGPKEVNESIALLRPMSEHGFISAASPFTMDKWDHLFIGVICNLFCKNRYSLFSHNARR